MRPSLLASSLLVFSLILSVAQGIRLGKGFIAEKNKHQKVHYQEDGSLLKTSNGGVGDEVVLVQDCKNGDCSSGNYRKLMTTTTTSSSTSTTTTSKVRKEGKEAHPQTKSKRGSHEEEGGKEEIFSANSSPMSEHREATPEGYPDIIDIAGMDYTPARKKSPIHN